MTTHPSAFEDVRTPSRGEHSLSPWLDEVGLLITMPTVASGQMPVCGTFELDAVALERLRGTSDIALVAVEASSHTPYAAQEPHADETPPIVLDGTLVEAHHQGWFNLDVAELCRLPDEPGVYYVFAVLGDLQSNVCRVQWEGR